MSYRCGDTLRSIARSSVDANSVAEELRNDGDPWSAREYLLTSHSGNVNVSIPMGAAVEIKARSLEGDDRNLQGSKDLSAPAQRN